MVDAEALIAAVFKRPIIWDKKNKSLNANRVSTDKCWIEICQELETDEALLKKKWKYLRDQFAIEWAKSAHAKSGDTLDPTLLTSKWQYFHQLLFLKDIVKPRMPPRYVKSVLSFATDIDNIASASQDCPVISLVDAGSDNTSDSGDDIDSQSHGRFVQPGFQYFSENSNTNNTSLEVGGGEQSRRRREQGSWRFNVEKKRKIKKAMTEEYYHRCLLQLEEKKIDFLLHKFKDQTKANDEEDNDLMFLKSLLPYLKRIPEETKLRFRSRLHDLVQEFAFPVQNIPPVCAPVLMSFKTSPQTPSISNEDLLQ